MTKNPFGAVERHLLVHEEAWKAEHDRAMECFDCEEWLAAFVWLYDLIQEVDRLYRSKVYRGVVQPGTADEQLREVYRRWLAVADELARDVARLEAEFGHLAKADDFRDRVALANEQMARPAQRLAIAPGSRLWDVTSDEAEQLAKLVAGPPSVHAIAPVDIPTASSSLIR